MHSATPSTAKAAAWMAGWLTLMLIITVAGREATRDVAVFQLMAMRSVIGLVLLWPLLHAYGGLAAIRTSACATTPRATWCTTVHSTRGSWR